VCGKGREGNNVWPARSCILGSARRFVAEIKHNLSSKEYCSATASDLEAISHCWKGGSLLKGRKPNQGLY
jgi:hypothetical protein